MLKGGIVVEKELIPIENVDDEGIKGGDETEIGITGYTVICSAWFIK